MELPDYARLLRNQWRLIVLCALVIVGAAVVVTSSSTPQYMTSVGFFISAPDRSGDASNSSSAYTGSLFSQQRVKSYASIVSGPQFADLVATDLDGLASGAVEGRITAVAVPDTVLLTVKVVDPSPTRALALAQSVTRLFPQYAEALEKTESGDTATVKVRTIQDPRLPSKPFSPHPVRNVGVALFLGLVVGVGLAVLREALDNTIKSPEDILTATGSSTLGLINYDPAAPKQPLVVPDAAGSPRVEAFRQLRTNLQFIEVDEPLRSITVTSSVPNEGKSTTACNLAITLAQGGVRTVLVEGDLRRPRMADYLGIEGAVGLTSVLIGRVTLEDALQPYGDGKLQVLSSGPLPPNPSELLSSQGMSYLVSVLEEAFDVVIIDSPPLLPVTDAAILATLTSGAVLVVKCSSTRQEQMLRASGVLKAFDAKILGTVLNMIPRRGPNAADNFGGYGSNPHKLRMSDEEAALSVRSSM